jgi:cytochrome P450
VQRIVSGTNTQAAMKPCLLREIQDSNLAEVEKTPDRLLQEAEQFIVAGTETTGNTLTVTTFHILRNPHVQRALRGELKRAQLLFDENIDLAAIQSLPYLVRCH